MFLALQVVCNTQYVMIIIMLSGLGSLESASSYSWITALDLIGLLPSIDKCGMVVGIWA
jgi:hypothetical protein